MSVTPKEQEELAARLTFLRTEANFGSWRDFAAEAGLSASFFTSKLSQLVAGTGSSINGKAAAAIIDACDKKGVRVPLKWLLNGDGPGPEVSWRRNWGEEVSAAQPPMVDRQEVEVANRDATAEGRWHRYAARYPGFRSVATFRHREEGVPDTVLDSAADELGAQKSDTGPTEEETDRAIDKWLKRTPNRASKEIRAGRDATPDDFAPSAAAPRKRR